MDRSAWVDFDTVRFTPSTCMCLATLLFSMVARPCPAADESVYVSWPPVEPDTCIAAWLIKSFVDTNAVFRFVPKGNPVENGIPFDIPGSRYVRDHKRSASEAVLELHHIDDHKARAAAALARKLELAFWNAAFTEEERPLVSRLRAILADPSSPDAALAEALNALGIWSSRSP